MSQYKGNFGTLNILLALQDQPTGLTAHGIYRKLLAANYFMGMNSVSPTLSNLAKERQVKKIYAMCDCCGTRKARYVLSPLGKQRIHDHQQTRELEHG